MQHRLHAGCLLIGIATFAHDHLCLPDEAVAQLASQHVQVGRNRVAPHVAPRNAILLALHPSTASLVVVEAVHVTHGQRELGLRGAADVVPDVGRGRVDINRPC